MKWKVYSTFMRKRERREREGKGGGGRKESVSPWRNSESILYLIWMKKYLAPPLSLSLSTSHIFLSLQFPCFSLLLFLPIFLSPWLQACFNTISQIPLWLEMWDWLVLLGQGGTRDRLLSIEVIDYKTIYYQTGVKLKHRKVDWSERQLRVLMTGLLPFIRRQATHLLTLTHPVECGREKLAADNVPDEEELFYGKT